MPECENQRIKVERCGGIHSTPKATKSCVHVASASTEGDARWPTARLDARENSSPAVTASHETRFLSRLVDVEDVCVLDVLDVSIFH